MSIDFEKNLALIFVFSKDLKEVLLFERGDKLDGYLHELENIRGISLIESAKDLNIITKTKINPKDFRLVTTLPHIEKKWIITVFATMHDFSKLEEREPYMRCQIDKLPSNVIPSLHWLIPLCLDVSIVGSGFNQLIMR
jgi:hypothetical protein